MKLRKSNENDAAEFNRAVSVIIDQVSSATEDELHRILTIQHDLLKLTLTRIQEQRLKLGS